MTAARSARRSGTRRGVLASLGVASTVVACVAVGLTAAQATEGTDPAFGEWVFSHVTDPQPDPTPPADPDGESGETNVLNTIELRDRHEDWVPGATTTETTEWRVDAPPGDGWNVVDQRTVVDQEAVPATPDSWVDPVWHVYAGNHDSDSAPALDDPKWHPNSGDPQSANHAFVNHTPMVPYFVDKANGRGSDWFLWTATLVPGDPGQESVTHEEYRYERTVVTEGQMLYSWSVYVRTNLPGEPGEGDPTDTSPSDAAPSDVGDEQQERAPSTADRQGRGDGRPQAVPLSIDAGL